MRRGWWLLRGVMVALVALCGMPALALWNALSLPPEVRPPHPRSQLLATRAVEGAGGRVVRTYRVGANIRDVIEWYRDEGGGTSVRVPDSVAGHCSQNRITETARPAPLVLWRFVLTTDVSYCPTGEGVQVTTISYYRWKYVGP